MKTIFETFKKSIYDPAFYRSAGKEPFWDIFHYYAKVILILSAVMTVVLGLLLIPVGVSFVKDHAPDLIKTYYPAGLVVHIEKGEATANVKMPYIIPVKQMLGITPPADALQNMFVIDTTRDFDKKIFQDYKTYALLTKTDLVTQNDRGQTTIQSLRTTPIMTMSQEVLLGWVEKIRGALGYIVFFGIVATFVILMLGYLGYLVLLLIFALVPLVIAWLKKTPLSYREAYKMSMYAILPALALKTIINLMGVLFIPSYFTLLVFMLIIALNMREVNQPKLFNN